MSSEKRDLARKRQLELSRKRRKQEETARDEYRDNMRDMFRYRPPMSRRAAPGSEIGTEDDGYKASEMQQLRDKYLRKDDTYTGKVIKSIKPSGKQPV